MSTKTPDGNEATDSEYIEGEIVEVRMDGPADKGRTITVPGDAPLDVVRRRALQVTFAITDYDFCHVGLVNGHGIRMDGTLYDKPHPDFVEEE